MQLACLAAMTLALSADPRRWEDEIVYGIIIEKFFDGDSSNNLMRNRFLKDRAKYEGGFWGGDLKGVIDRLDDLADLGITTILLYPVVQNDEKPIGKFLPTGYRPKDYERVDVNFGDAAVLRVADRRGPRPCDQGDSRYADHAARVRASVCRRSSEERLVWSADTVWSRPLEGGKARGGRLLDRHLQAVERALALRRFPHRFRSPPAGPVLEAICGRAQGGPTSRAISAPA